MRRTLAIFLLALVVSACGSSSAGSTHSAASSASSSATGASSGATGTGSGSGSGCARVSAPAPKPSGQLSAPHLTLDAAKTYTVTVATNCGTFTFTLDVRESPKTSASFYSLVKQGFFDNTTFHRVAAGFVIQGGDPTGTGGGGPGYTVVEPPPANTQYALGDVAMAKTQTQPSGASGSQFFIVTGQNATGLTPDYALVGKVLSGIGVVQRIGALPTSPPQDGAPTSPVVMSRVTVSAS